MPKCDRLVIGDSSSVSIKNTEHSSTCRGIPCAGADLPLPMNSATRANANTNKFAAIVMPFSISGEGAGLRGTASTPDLLFVGVVASHR